MEFEHEMDLIWNDYSFRDLPPIESKVFLKAQILYEMLFEQLIQIKLAIPPLNISYYEGFNGSLELSLIRPHYRIAINLSSELLLYSILHRYNSKIVKKGSIDLVNIDNQFFMDALVSDIAFFEAM